MALKIISIFLVILTVCFIALVIFAILKIAFNKIIKLTLDKINNKNNSKKPIHQQLDEAPSVKDEKIQSAEDEDLKRQIKYVTDTSYVEHKIINDEAVKVFYIIEEWLNNRGMKERVFPEIPLYVYLETSYRLARTAIGHKRTDFVIVNKYGDVECAIEYQGSGHFIDEKAAKESDAIKAAALAHAGIPLIEILEEDKNNKDKIFKELEENLPDNIKPS